MLMSCRATVSINTTDGRNHLTAHTFEINAVQRSVCAPGTCQFSSPGMSKTQLVYTCLPERVSESIHLQLTIKRFMTGH